MSAATFPTVRLCDVCEFKPPKSLAKRALSDDALVSFAPMNDLGELRMDFQPSAERPLAEVLKSYTYFADGDVICAKITPCFENGKMGVAAGLMNGVGFGSSEFVVMRPSPRLLPQYLFYFMLRDDFREAGAKVMTGAVGHKRVPNEFFERLEVPLPPLYEQKRIVAVLDQAFAALDRALALAEANLADAEEVFDSFGEALFTEVLATAPEKRPLGDLTAPGSGITYGVVKPGGEGSVAFVRGGDLVNGEVRMGQLRTISKEFSEQYRRTLLRGGELLICLVGTPGQCAIAPTALAGANIARQVGMIRLRESLCAEYVRDYLLSKVGQQALGLKTGGSVQQVINLGDLKLIEVPLPDKARQVEIVAQLQAWKSATDALRQRYRDSVRNIAELRQSLLQKAFAGELT